MKKIARTFENIWKDAQAINATTTRIKQRFFKIYSVKGKNVQLGLYDAITKRWTIFDSINLSGNYRYVDREQIPEITEMKAMIRLAQRQA